MPVPSGNNPQPVTVRAHARLHLGFLDLNGGLQRRFGSIGVALEDIVTGLSVCRSGRSGISGAIGAEIADCARAILDHFGIDAGIQVTLHRRIPQHQGLGSGTQMALALGTAICTLFDVNAGVQEIAVATGRGKRSGIGLGVFERGGFVVDSGRRADQAVPTLVTRLEFPQTWCFVLVHDDSIRGKSGACELEAFRELPGMDAGLSAEVCRLVLMQTLPAILETDCVRFGESISRIQHICGDYFSAVQGGAFTSPAVGVAIKLLLAGGATGAGQTSWGPTGFALFPDRHAAQAAVDKIRRDNLGYSSLRFHLTCAENGRARINTGATVTAALNY